MNKNVLVLATLTLLSQLSFAQTIESEVDAEINKMYSKLEGVESKKAVADSDIPQVKPVAAPLPSVGQPIYIVNQAPTSNAQLQQNQVQKQPVTNTSSNISTSNAIEASPIGETAADRIRKNRQEAEVQTEQKVVEKIEQSRINDEQKRASVLFDDRFEQLNSKEQQTHKVPPVVQPVIIQHIPEPKENTRDIIREELTAAMKEEEKSAQLPPPANESKYVAGLVGVGDYPSTQLVKGNYALGVSFGSRHDSFVVEGSFLFSDYTVQGQGYYSGLSYPYGYGYGYFTPDTIAVQQYTGALAAKVQLFDGMVKPVFGGLVAYSYRDFSWNNISYGYNTTTASSNAVDVGALVGADIQFSPKYSLGVDYRYMWNVTSRLNAGNSWMSGPQYGNEIERLQYYVLSLVGRVNF